MQRTVAVLATLLAMGCATGWPSKPAAEASAPRTSDCRELGRSQVMNAGGRVVLDGLSILPPAGPNWCIQAQDARRVTFLRPGSSLLGASNANVHATRG